MYYRGYRILLTFQNNYRVPDLASTAATLATAKRWIDQAIACGELRRTS